LWPIVYIFVFCVVFCGPFFLFFVFCSILWPILFFFCFSVNTTQKTKI
jgi:hypothetical protein